jgi:intraflagellar transport protein 81
LAKIEPLQEQLKKLQEELKEKKPDNNATPMLQGEDFKRYVSELRGKSTNFKRKKSELSAIDVEFGILERTKELLNKKIIALQTKISQAEKKGGVMGYHDAQVNLEKVSELKSEKDQQKGEQLQEISGIIQKLMNSINEKKTLLAPVIQKLRSMRQEAQELQYAFNEKKKSYDSVMIGLEKYINY